ncbi:MAG: type II toxin-antitoxin system Phd/YefM family antitoxin [Deltaproteobacteria bacterium]|jgi:prevent-host-death family protein|nr:type II toxin-antitoxin system Phd/YefM family antitoxin [Deltaproteobacteria bacterium]MCD6199642.1 type II toxin-antitoxin system Phd/YefM family antitoxin [Deltaproteobacteria bacterium]
MKYSQAIKPISYLKAHASEIIRDISANQDTMIITHNGEAKVVVQDIRVFEETQESMAMLKMLAQSSANIKKGEYKPLDKAFSDLRKRIEDAQ